jgi:hypothetical protein
MEDVSTFYGHLVHFMVFCYILFTFGIVRGDLVFFPVLVFCTKKNLATLPCFRSASVRSCLGGSGERLTLFDAGLVFVAVVPFSRLIGFNDLMTLELPASNWSCRTWNIRRWKLFCTFNIE